MLGTVRRVLADGAGLGKLRRAADYWAAGTGAAASLDPIIEGKPFTVWWALYWECHHGTGMGGIVQWRTLDAQPALMQPYLLTQVWRTLTVAIVEAQEARSKEPQEAGRGHQ